MAYGILAEHNTSGNMEQLQIKFDKLTSHDITFVGIIQTARASGLEKFPIPYAIILYVRWGGRLMRMTICSGLLVPRDMAACMYRLIRQSSTSMPGRCLQAAAR